MNKWQRVLRWIAGVLAALLVLVGLAWLGLPILVKKQLEQRGSALLGRSLRVHDVDVSPFKLALTLHKLSLGAAPGSASKEPQAAIDRLYLDLNWKSLLRLAPVLEAVQVDGPKLRLARLDEGRYDIDDVLQRLQPDPAAPPSPPQRFALYNLQVRGGELRFEDRPVGRTHRMGKLEVSLPFLSNLPADVEVQVQPHVAFVLNGTAFDSGASATPFGQQRSADLRLKFDGYDLGPLQAYLPKDLPLRPTRGRLDANLELLFAQGDEGSQVVLRGELAARDVNIAQTGQGTVATWSALRLGLADVRPLDRRVGLGTLRLEGLNLELQRDEAGHFTLWPGSPASAAATPGATAASRPAASAASAAKAAASAGSAPAGPASKQDWQVKLASVELVGAQLHWRDASTQPAARLQARGLNLKLEGPQWPLRAPVGVHLDSELLYGEKLNPAGRLQVDGTLAEDTAALALDLQQLQLGAAQPYLQPYLVPRLEGRLSAVGQLEWAGGETERGKLKLKTASLQDLKLTDASLMKVPPAGWKALDLGEAEVDWLAHTASIGKLALNQPSFMLLRDADGRWNVAHWLREADAAKPGASPASAPASASAVRPAVRPAKAASAPAGAASEPAPWQLELKDARLEGGKLRLVDAEVGDPPLALEVAELKLQAQGLRWPSDAKTTPAALQLQAKVLAAPASGSTRAGTVDWRGKLLPQPLRLEGQLRAERLPVHALQPYLMPGGPLELVRAELGWKGDVDLRQEAAGLQVKAKGDLLLADLNLAARKPGGGGDELLTWHSLALQGVNLAVAPNAKPRVDVTEAALSDFYARLMITEQGRFNFQDGAAAGTPATAASAASAASGAASGGAAPGAGAPATALASASAASAAASGSAAAGLPLDLVVGRTRLINGKVDFSDHFIRPNYSAALTELNGSLGRFASGSRDMAVLELKGRAAGTALLEIGGSINPAVTPLAMDLRAKATDLELAPLSPYAGKYAGYAIERGKLSMEVAYNIQPDGKLDAKNKLVLNQLTFGDKVDSPDATKLPVLLAVALLKDRNGVIDINLPVSGSLNDPQFSVGGIVLKVIVNLLTKALTAPFALLAGGGGEDLSLAEFEPGTARLTAKGQATVDKVAQALLDRPTLRMTVTGAADPASERPAMQAEALAQAIRNEHRREKLRAGVASDAALPPPTAEERARLVKQIYTDAKLPGKPRNALGMAKELPLAEMEGLLKAGTVVSTDSARELALQRGLAVRDALVAKGLPGDRLFLAAPKLRASGEDEAAWTPRVQLSLSTQ